MKSLEKPSSMSPQEWFLRRLSTQFNLPVSTIKKVVNNNFKQMNQAFGKDGVTSIEWVGVGKFLVSQVRVKKTIEKNLSKIEGAKEILKVEDSQRLHTCIDHSQELIKVLKTKLKDVEFIADIRRLEEQLDTREQVGGLHKGGSPEKNGDLQEL